MRHEADRRCASEARGRLRNIKPEMAATCALGKPSARQARRALYQTSPAAEGSVLPRELCDLGPCSSQAADNAADVAVNFGGGADDKALQWSVIDDRPWSAVDVPEGRVDGSLDQRDEIRTIVRRDRRASEGQQRAGAALGLIKQRQAGSQA